MPTRRQLRVAELLQRELAQLILYELGDPRLHLVSVTGVEVTADLRQARVYVSQLGADEDNHVILEALDNASGFLRKALGQRVQLRHVPELVFFFDQALIRGRRMEALLDELVGPAHTEGTKATVDDSPPESAED